MCPVCRARFRGASLCSRCGADLTAVMTLAAAAWRLRQAARHALAAGEFARVCELAAEAQQTCSTPSGRGLEGLGQWLAGQDSEPSGKVELREEAIS
jgi:hypothetical protein